MLAPVIARIMYEMNMLVLMDGVSNMQQYTLKKELIKFGEHGKMQEWRNETISQLYMF